MRYHCLRGLRHSQFTGIQLAQSIKNAFTNDNLRVDGVFIVSRNDTAALKALDQKIKDLHIPAQIVAWSGSNSSEDVRTAFTKLLNDVEGSAQDRTLS